MSDTIFFDELEDISFDLENQMMYDEPEPSKKKKSKNIEKPKIIKRNRLGLTEDETETVIAVVLGFVFLSLIVGTLCGYTHWYLNIR